MKTIVKLSAALLLLVTVGSTTNSVNTVSNMLVPRASARSIIVVDPPTVTVTMAEQGVVKWFNDKKGYGFIVRERGADIFVHHASIIAEGHRTLSEGDRVSFDVVEGPKGLQANKVVKIS